MASNAMPERSSVAGLDYRLRVIDELSDDLDAIQNDIAEFVSDPDNTDSLSLLLRKVRNVGRTLSLVRVRGAVLLARELDKLLVAIADQRVRSESDASMALVRASAKLPEYLDYIRHGSADFPLALLPLLNDMRAVRGTRLLSEAVIVLPNYSHRRKSPPGSLDAEREEQFRRTLKQSRTSLMQALLKWYRDLDVEQSLYEIGNVLDGLRGASRGTDLARLWKLANAVLVSLQDGGLEHTASVKSLFGQVERFIQQLLRLKSKAIYQVMPKELFKNLLYYVALSESADKRVLQLQSAYKLHDLLPSEALREQAQHVLAGPGPKMLEAAAAGMKAEIAELKTAIEIAAHADEFDPARLGALPDTLENLSATLEMLGMHRVAELSDQLRARVIAYAERSDQNASMLSVIATDILAVENALEDAVRSREQLLGDDALEVEPGTRSPDSQSVDELQASLLTEALCSLERIKTHYQKALEHTQLDEQFAAISAHLRESAGALQILPMPEVALLMERVATYTDALDARRFSALPATSHDRFADVISGLEVYLELHIQRQPAVADLLAQSAEALEALEVLLSDSADASDVDNTDGDDDAFTAASVELQEKEEPVSAEPEMLNVFVEEAMQQFHLISEKMTQLRQTPDDRDALERIRRAYHTLKGSGRMVGAVTIAEFAWANENLLNHVLTGTTSLNAAACDLLDESVAALPQLIDQLHGASERVEGIDELKAQAFLLAEGDIQEPASAHAGVTLAELEAREQQAASPETMASPESSNERIVSSDKASIEAGEPVLDMTQTLDLTGAIGASDTLQLPPMDQADTIEVPMGLGEGDSDVVRVTPVKAESDPQFDPESAQGQSPTGVDPVLFEIFSAECAQHIAIIKDIVEGALGGDGKLQTSEKMVRALHTLTGSAQTARVDSIATLLSPVEDAVKRMQRAGERFSRGETLYLSEVIKALEAKLHAIASAEAEPAFVADVEARLESFTGRVKTETEAVTRAPRLGELQSVFLEEAQDIAELIRDTLAQWKAKPQDRGLIAQMQAVLHTLKGSARVASYTGIADLAHAMEDAVQRWADTAAPIDPEALDALDDAVGAIGINLEQAKSGEQPGYFDWLITELRSIRTDYRLESADDTPAMPTPAPSQEAVDAVADAPAPVAPSARATPPPDLPADEPASERVRVDLGVIERLTELVNESGVHQAQLGVHQSLFAEALVELDHTVSRLRQQMRELDIESETNLPAAKAQPDAGFDALEMDRYGRLQEISRGILESFSDLDDIRYSLGVSLRHAEVELNEQTRIHNSLQETLGHIHLVRFSSVVTRLQKVVADAARACNKKVSLTVEGVDNVIDRSVLKHVLPPLEHLLRNAVAHGIEARDKRKSLDKKPTGALGVRMQLDEGDIVLTVQDDGAGINTRKVRKKALEQGIIPKNTRLTDSRLLELLMVSGFSTSNDVDQISGRGVGLDAVRRGLAKVGGVVTLHTEPKIGSTFTLRIPQVQFVSQVVLLRLQTRSFAIAANRVHGVSRVSRSEVAALDASQEAHVEYNGQHCRYVRLADLLDLPASDAAANASLVYVTVLGETLALQVETVQGHMETLIRPVGEQLRTLGAYSGACVQADGAVIPVLDLNTLISRYLDNPDAPAQGKESVVAVRPERRLRVLVVDDSITMRKYAERTLLRENHFPILARDGVEAMQMMQQRAPDLVLTDLEMPHMDGFELVAMIRENPVLSRLPIIVISSRSGAKHRKRLAKRGIQGFLAKPYQASELLELVNAVRDTEALTDSNV